VVLGDSYSAGNGTALGKASANGPNRGYLDGAYRSNRSYGQEYVNWLNAQGVSASLTNLAASGAVTTTVLREQVPAVPVGTDVVMLTIGGNDGEFRDIVQRCFAVAVRSATGCQGAVTTAEQRFPEIVENTRQILEALEQRLGPDVEVVLVGYPRMALDVRYTLSEPRTVRDANGRSRSELFTYEAGRAVRGLGASVDVWQRERLVEPWNLAHDLRVTYVPTAAAFAGHEPDPSALTRNSYRWVNEFFETGGTVGANGKTVSVFSSDANNWYHPNIAGHRAIAAEIAQVFGMPDVR